MDLATLGCQAVLPRRRRGRARVRVSMAATSERDPRSGSAADRQPAAHRGRRDSVPRRRSTRGLKRSSSGWRKHSRDIWRLTGGTGVASVREPTPCAQSLAPEPARVWTPLRSARMDPRSGRSATSRRSDSWRCGSVAQLGQWRTRRRPDRRPLAERSKSAGTCWPCDGPPSPSVRRLPLRDEAAAAQGTPPTRIWA
jgi:hypothetical protein